jgi:hypothetical protein
VSSADNSWYIKPKLGWPWLKAPYPNSAAAVRMLANGNIVIAGFGTGDQQSLYTLSGLGSGANQLPSSAPVSHYDMTADNATAVAICASGCVCYRTPSTFSWTSPGSWTELGTTMCSFVAVKPLSDGSLLGVASDGQMWSKAGGLTSGSWASVGTGGCCARDVDQYPNGTLLVLQTDGKLYTKATLASPLVVLAPVSTDTLPITKISLCSEPRSWLGNLALWHEGMQARRCMGGCASSTAAATALLPLTCRSIFRHTLMPRRRA